MNELERRVTQVLHDRVDGVESHLTGPAIRAAARRRHVIAPLAAAAAVLIVVLVTVALARPHHPHRVQPGGPVSVITTRVPPPTVQRSTLARVPSVPGGSSAIPVGTRPVAPLPSIGLTAPHAATTPGTPPGALRSGTGSPTATTGRTG